MTGAEFSQPLGWGSMQVIEHGLPSAALSSTALSRQCVETPEPTSMMRDGRAPRMTPCRAWASMKPKPGPKPPSVPCRKAALLRYSGSNLPAIARNAASCRSRSTSTPRMSDRRAQRSRVLRSSRMSGTGA